MSFISDVTSLSIQFNRILLFVSGEISLVGNSNKVKGEPFGERAME